MAKYVQYSPADVVIMVNFKPVVGWESITVEFGEDKNTKHMGIDGSGRFIRSLRSDGSITIELIDYSPSNADFIGVDKLDFPVVVTVVDKTSKGSLFITDSAKIVKVPSLARSGEGGTNEWEFAFLKGEISHGTPVEL